MFADGTTNDVAERGTYGDGYVEDGEDSVALVFGVEVGEECGGEDAEAGLAYAQRGMADVE